MSDTQTIDTNTAVESVQSEIIPVFIMGKRYDVPDSLTIMKTGMISDLTDSTAVFESMVCVSLMRTSLGGCTYAETRSFRCSKKLRVASVFMSNRAASASKPSATASICVK